MTTATTNTPHHEQRPLLFTIARTMHELSLSRSTINRYADAGRLEKVLIGPNSARITTASIYALLGKE